MDDEGLGSVRREDWWGEREEEEEEEEEGRDWRGIGHERFSLLLGSCGIGETMDWLYLL